MEKFRGKKPEQLNNLSESAAFRWQANSLRRTLNKLEIRSVTVSPEMEVRDANFFRQRRTLAYTDCNQGVVAIVASSGDVKEDASKAPVSTLLVIPTEKGTGILVDKQTGKFYTDSFWVCEDETFKFIKTTEPVPIDVFDVTYNERLQAGFSRYVEEHRQLGLLADDKQRTKELLKQAGLNVPEGICLMGYNYHERVNAFLLNNPGKGIAVKPNSEVQGRGVGLFDADQEAEVKHHVQDLLIKGHKVHVEERIIPPPTSKLRVHSDEVDYNFRILTTLDPDSPRTIDGLIRYTEKGVNPVNISQGAKATRIDTLEDPELAARLAVVAEKATSVLCRQVTKTGDKIFGVAGVDLMIDEKEDIYVLEVNTGWVGGFSVLARLDKEPLSSVKNILISSAAPQLEENFQRRSAVIPENLHEIPASSGDKENAYRGHIAIRDYISAQTILLDLADDYLNNRFQWLVRQFVELGNRMGTYDAGVNYADKVLEQKPDNSSAILLKEYIQGYMQRNPRS